MTQAETSAERNAKADAKVEANTPLHFLLDTNLGLSVGAKPPTAARRRRSGSPPFPRVPG